MQIDFSVDRFNYNWNARFLLFLGMLLLTYRFTMKPLNCSLPPGFHEENQDFVENQCLATGSFFYVTRSDEFEHLHTKDNRIDYNVAPFYFMMMAVASYMPYLIWTSCLKAYGDHTFDFIQNGVETRDDIGFDEKATGQTVEIFEELLSEFRNRIFFGGNLVARIHLIVKAAYLAVSLGHIFFLNYVFDFSWNDYIMIGTTVYSQGLWEKAIVHSLFPATSTCVVRGYHSFEMPISAISTCSMNINVYYRNIMPILWFTNNGMVILNFFSFLYTAVWTLSGFFRKRAVRFSLRQFLNKPKTENNANRFINQHLHADGLLVLELLRASAGPIVFKAVCTEAFKRFHRNHPNSTEKYEV